MQVNIEEFKKSAYPNSIISGKGSKIFDIDKNKCVDFVEGDKHVFFLVYI